MSYKPQIKKLEEEHRKLSDKIKELEKGNTSKEQLVEFYNKRQEYMEELRRLNKLQWEHDHESVDFGDDR
jgi:hypothetical protein